MCQITIFPLSMLICVPLRSIGKEQTERSKNARPKVSEKRRYSAVWSIYLEGVIFPVI